MARSIQGQCAPVERRDSEVRRLDGLVAGKSLAVHALEEMVSPTAEEVTRLRDEPARVAAFERLQVLAAAERRVWPLTWIVAETRAT